MSDFLESLLVEAADSIIDKTESEVDIIIFCEHPYYLDQPLHSVEKFILKVFYGLPLDDTEKSLNIRSFPFDKDGTNFTEVEYARFLRKQHRTNLKDPSIIKKCMELILVCGRRSGKTFIASVISAYEAYRLIMKRDPQRYYKLPKGEIIKITNVASASDQALILARATQARILNSKWFVPYIEGKNQSEIRLRTKYDLERLREETLLHGKPIDSHYSILIEAMACSSRAIRGGTVIVCLFDELAHFIDNEGNRSGDMVYEALTPSVATFGLDGKIIEISSPFIKSGVFFDHYIQALGEEKNDYEGDQNKRVFQVPTWEMNDKISFEFLESEKKRNPESFSYEFGAEFSTTISGFFKYPEKIDECIVREVENLIPVKHGMPHYIAVDPSSNRNGYAIAMVHVEDKEVIKIDKDKKEIKTKEKVVVLDRWRVWNLRDPEFEGLDYIDQEVIENYIELLLQSFKVVKIVYDQFDSSASILKFKKMGINAEKTSFSRSYNMKIYNNLRTLVYEKRLELFNDKNGIAELKALQERKVGKKQFMVEAPLSGPVTTDDMPDVLANACYIAVGEQVDKINASIVGTNGNEIFRTSGERIASYNSYQRKLKNHRFTSNFNRAMKFGLVK